MAKVLITGASGFIGSFLVEEALNRGFEVWAGVRKSSSLAYLQDKRIHCIDLNFGDVSALKNQLLAFKQEFGNWDFVIHNLGATKVMRPDDFDRINFQFTRNLVASLIDCGMTPRKFIYMSSLSVCGPFDEVGRSMITEDYDPCPNTIYGISKRKAELYLQNLTDFSFIILRPTGVYGPREKDYFMMLKTIQAGFDFGVGITPQYLSFIYVRDLARVAFLAIEKPVVNRTYFVSDGNSYLGSDFREIAQKYLPKKNVISISLPLILVKVVSLFAENWAKLFGKSSTLNADKYKIMAQRNWICDISPIQKELHFEANYDLTKGLRESIEWYKQNNWL